MSDTAGHDAAGAWRELAGQVDGCRACDLGLVRTHAVPGDLPDPYDGGPVPLLLVGEAPGADEDALGRPFVGRSGRLLDQLLDEAGLDRTGVAVANVLKCRPPGNRAPRARELAACRPWLHRQLALLQPRVVVTLGGSATTWFFGRGARLTTLRGRPHEVDGRTVFATYHPSAALRFGPRGAPLAGLREDLGTVAGWLAR
ncbi:MAG: uracil-DNA glycosylase [Candidatus Nanopelagicales bacterium]